MIEETLRIKQTEIISDFLKSYKAHDMVVVYRSEYSQKKYGTCNLGIHSAFVPNDQIDSCLSNFTWDLLTDEGCPRIEKYIDGHVEYSRFGNDKGIEPLIISRNFFGMYENDIEISEEFRLFFNLFYNRQEKSFYKVLDDGNVEKIIEIDSIQQIVKVRNKELLSFAYTKDMSLALFIDSIQYSDLDLNSVGVESDDFINEELAYLRYSIKDCTDYVPEHNTLSRLCGKRFLQKTEIEENIKSKSSKKFIEFIIDTDSEGVEIESTCNKDELKNNFGQNSDAFHYLTPISFRKSVLEKYYNEPSKYEVNDAMLSCGSLWSIHLDNDHKDKVCVWLGDLSNLSYEEQSYWRSFNVIPDGNISSTFYKRQIQAQFSNSEQPEHVFLIAYNELLKESKSKLGWSIILPLTTDDEHFLKTIRLPSSNEQKVFDELVLSLTKVLIDSINEKELRKVFKLLNQDTTELKGSVSIIKHLFDLLNLDNYEEVVIFLRGLQRLRSTSSAHRKGSQYQKVAKELGILENGRVETFNNLLEQSIDYLIYLKTYVIEALVNLNSDYK